MRRVSKTVVVLLVILGASLPALPVKPSVDLQGLVRLIRSDIQPDQAMDFMRRVYATDRWFTFPKLQETAEYLRRTMEDIGLKDVELLGRLPMV